MSIEENKEVSNQNSTIPFVMEVTRYFMDFLETDFHKVRNPKRQIRYKNKDNLQVCVDLTKYEKYSTLLWQAINKGYKTDGTGFVDNSIIELKKNVYTTKVSKTLIQLIEEQISKINEKDIETIINKFKACISVVCKKNEKNAIEALNQALSSISQIIKDDLIIDFIENIKEPLHKLTNSVEGSIYQVETDLVEILIEPFEEIVSTIVNKKILNTNDEDSKHIHAVFNIDDIKNKLSCFFKSFDVSDLFVDALELISNKNILDKQECYLYLCDITYKNNKYPIFYIPVQLEKVKDNIILSFDPLLYINKRAVNFVMHDISSNDDKKRTLRLFSERIIYLSEIGGQLIGNIDEALKELVAYFNLSTYIDVKSPSYQRSQSKELIVSNKCYLALFDNADESLVNDYEEILEKIKQGGDDIARAFNVLIDDFIRINPESHTLEIDANWDCTSFEEKLVYKTPVPLNEEQRKILAASKNKGCKYITVEGPPGTGKSHTITSIICDAILDNKSILVLSDKKEALDVVENKIKDTLDQVRVGDNFQNPILRLGQAGNTYTKILSSTSMERIKDHHKGTKNLIDDVNLNVVNNVNLLERRLKKSSSAYFNIKIEDISRFELLEKFILSNELPIDFDELCQFDNMHNEIVSLIEAVEVVKNRLESDSSILLNLFKKMYKENMTFSSFKEFISFIKIAKNLLKQLEKHRKLLKKIDSINSDVGAYISKFVVDCEALKFGWFGYLFNYKKAQILAREFNSRIPNSFISLQYKLDELKVISQIAQAIVKKKQEYQIKHGVDFDFDLVFSIHELIVFDFKPEMFESLEEINNNLDVIENFTKKYVNTANKFGISQENFLSIFNNKLIEMNDEQISKLVNYFKLRANLTANFFELPSLNFRRQKNEIENLVTIQMTHKIDESVINFYEKNRADAKALAGVIAKKQKFNKDIFGKLKNAFPCILAGIRDFAEYIPLESDIFDIVIIDEASQVSIAQALPALLRGKKIIVFGDRLQFCNVKSAQARSVINQEYLNSIKEVFTATISKDNMQIDKLNKFNIKTSILDFFERISNYSIMLKKHFRGYRELISYSNKFFYDDRLQSIKIRSKHIDNVIKFTVIQHDDKLEAIDNTNSLEIDAIVKEVERICAEQKNVSVGIITPHTNQQKLLSNMFQQHQDIEKFIQELKLKVMTFDTCQGEERDIIIYSMVASQVSDKLWAIFIKNRESIDKDGESSIKLQRLNVGFSRAKECMHFFISKPVEEFSGSIREALQHYHNTHKEACDLPTVLDTDIRSPMEEKILSWIQDTPFFKHNASRINFIAQFPIGEYIKQLDRLYTHPKYRVDFFMGYRDENGKQYNIVIEYDGFEYHFKKNADINEYNYQHYYNDDDIYREKILESYGYTFIRVNRFNIGKDPVASLNKMINFIIDDNTKQSIVDDIHSNIYRLQESDLKECLKCLKIKPMDEFKDKKLVTGYGRYCTQCKEVGTTIKSLTIANNMEEILCPKCGSLMIIRTRRKDQKKFLGCSKYPHCNGTKQYN